MGQGQAVPVFADRWEERGRGWKERWGGFRTRCKHIPDRHWMKIVA